MKKILLILCCVCNMAMAQLTVSDSAMPTGVRLRAHANTASGFTNAGIVVDDEYSLALPIGFTFNFYGTNYTQCVASPNCAIVFNTALAGNYASWVIDSQFRHNPIVYNSICMPWNDLDVSVGGTVYTKTEGTAPNRTFTLLYCGVRMFNCTSSAVTACAVLHETSNVIDIFIAHKPVCAGWNGGRAIEGVQNATGTDAVTVPGRDYPAVWTAENDAYRFTPIGGGSTYAVSAIPYNFTLPTTSSITYNWYDSATGVLLGSGDTITVHPTAPTTYKVQLLACGTLVSTAYIHTGPSCTGPSVAGSATSSTSTACSSTAITLTNTGFTTGSNLQWQSSPDGSTWANITGANSATYYTTGMTSTTYYRCSATCPTAGSTAYTGPVDVTYTSTCPCLLNNPGSIVASALYVCPTSTAGLADVTYDAPMAALQWQSSGDSVTWADIPGATNNTYDLTSVSATLYYRLKFSCTAGGAMYTGGTRIQYNAVCNCTGTPSAGTVSASPAVCDSCTITLTASGYTLADSITFQWQKSSDSATWSDIPGAIYYTLLYMPHGSFYYRCVIGCSTSGTSAYTPGLFVPYRYHIMSASPTFGSPCATPIFNLTVNGWSPTLYTITYFGDGTSDSSGIYATGSTGYLSIPHSYLFADTYQIKQVVYEGALAIDSVTYPFGYIYCNEFPIRFYYDIDGDCTQSGTEPANGIPLLVGVALNGVPIDTLSATSGINYFVTSTSAGDVYSFELLAPATVTCPGSAILYDTVSTTLGSIPTQYVGLSCPSAGMDLAVYDISGGAGPNRLRGNIYASNNSCISTSATVSLSYASYYYDHLNTAPTCTTLSGTTATWDLSGILNAGGVPVHLFYDAWAPFSSLAPLGAVVTTYVHIDPTTGDINTTNNDCNPVDTVRASWDPNSITAAACIPEDSTWIEYVLHFENTGNDTAHNIYVMDTLSYNLDMTGIRLVMASAPMNVAHITDGGYNVLRFDFMNINLPDSSHHGACDGAVIYKARTLPGTTAGMVIDNRAGIYFDVNDVVMTNTALTDIGCPTPEGIGAFADKSDPSLHPNPATGEVVVHTGKLQATIIVRNMLGQELMQMASNSDNIALDVSRLPAGLYNITVKADGVNKTLKLVKE